MKATQIKQYGQAAIRNVPEPEISDGQVLVKAKAGGVNPIDWKLMDGYMNPDLPYIAGGDFSGIIIKSSSRNFKQGDEVYGTAMAVAGGSGSFAEHIIANEGSIALKPRKASHDEAAAMPLAGVSALDVLKKMGLKKGQKILIHGGSGGIGSFAIQIAKDMGLHVATTASDTDYVRKLGADQALDYRKEDFTMLQDFDAVFDTVGGETYRKSFPVLKKGGIIFSMLEQPDNELMKQHGVRAESEMTRINTELLEELADLFDKGSVKVMIDRKFDLISAPEAIDYQKEGHPRGKVVIEM